MIRLIIASLILLPSITEATPQTLTPSEAFAKNKDAVVQIFVNNEFSGCGFIVSADGLVITANHVVTTADSDFTDVASKVEVKRIGERLHFATVISHSAVRDTAILRIISDGLPHVTLGDVESIQPSSAVTMITFLPDARWNVPLLVTGTVSGTAMVTTGKTQANTIILQMPIRKGFSGSPVFGPDGRAIGMVSTRLIGISQDLEASRKQLQSFPASGSVQILGADIRSTLLGLINTLDADLVSGLGSAIDIRYAKQMFTDATQNNKK